MGLCRLVLSVLVLAVFAEIAYGQGYEGRPRRPRCPPVCAMHCQYGNVLDSRGCATCQCNPGPINPGPFPPTLPTSCPSGSVHDGSTTICYPFTTLNNQCAQGSFCSGGPADEPGRCCIRNKIDTHPHCPAIRAFTTCAVRINSCDSTRRCPNGYKCCPRGCGNRCVPAFGDLYRPNRPDMPRIPRRATLLA